MTPPHTTPSLPPYPTTQPWRWRLPRHHITTPPSTMDLASNASGGFSRHPTTTTVLVVPRHHHSDNGPHLASNAGHWGHFFFYFNGTSQMMTTATPLAGKCDDKRRDDNQLDYEESFFFYLVFSLLTKMTMSMLPWPPHTRNDECERARDTDASRALSIIYIYIITPCTVLCKIIYIRHYFNLYGYTVQLQKKEVIMRCVLCWWT